MLSMTPAQSWALVMILVLAAAIMTWLLIVIDNLITHRTARKAEAEKSSLAPVTELRPRSSKRSALVRRVPLAATQTPYDWRVQGL